MKLLGIKKGFTLVEMLIVIAIVGILATISIGQYNQFRRVSVLDLAADSIVASINDARDSVKAGKVIGDSEASMCIGLKFEADSGVTQVSSKFNNQKNWSKNEGRWVRGGCLEVDNAVPGTPVSVGDSVIVESINLGEIESCSVLFSPPDGEVDKEASSCIKIRIGYGDGSVDLQRDININLNTGKAEIFKVTTTTDATDAQ